MEISKEGIAAFVTELVTYYMDFLETDFHKRKSPKRSIKFHNSKNLRIGLNLKKYGAFQSAALKVIAGGMANPLELSRGKYQAHISQIIQRLIAAQIKSISDEVVANVAKQITTIIVKIVDPKTTDIDKALSQSVDCATKIISSKIVVPFVKSIEQSLRTRNGADIESIYSLEENLIEIISDPLEELISEWVASVFGGQPDDITSRIPQILDGVFVRNSIESYFNSFSVNDLFFEINELVDNNLILDKQDIYFYFCDIQFHKDKYPLFYIPLTITKQEGGGFRVAFEPTVYVNKKAVEYIIQEFNKEREQQGTIKSLSERIIYPQAHQEIIPKTLNKVLSDIINFFHLSPEIDLTDVVYQKADGLSATVSNSMYICIFDKSDEALINDYEEILDLMKSQDTELIDSFTGLINDFIGADPTSFKDDIDDEWDEKSSEEKLVFSSPIPLNQEQRQILQALDKEDCKFIAVEGPPGTGKSHTITAIVFQAISHNQSVLMLSDKKEALDVIEEKIADVMNRVRIGDNFQNPILRLGKSGNTYGQILSTTSINKTRTHFRAVKNQEASLESGLCDHNRYLTSNIEATIASYGNVDIADIQNLVKLDSHYENGENYPIVFDEMLQSKDNISYVDEGRLSMVVLDDMLHYGADNHTLLDMFQSMCGSLHGAEIFSTFLDFAKVIQELRSTYQDRSFLKSFSTVTGEHVKALNVIIEKHRELGSGIFGYFFKGKEIAQLSHELNATLSFNTPIALKEDIDDMERASAFFGDANSALRQHGLLSFLADPLQIIYESILPDDHLLDEIDLNTLSECLKTINMYVQKYPLSAEKIGLSPSSSLHSCFENNLRNLSDDMSDDMLSHLSIHHKLTNAFRAVPVFDYTGGMASYPRRICSNFIYAPPANIF